jgi:hypothetical protein
MKAKHRHELETNALADRMGKLIQDVKENPKAATRFAWIVGGVIIAIVLAWYFVSGSSTSDQWVKLVGNDDPASLAQIATTSPTTMAGRAALLQRARILLPKGIGELYQGFDKAKAAEQIEEAKRLYTGLIPVCADDPILEQEAISCAAKAEESLLAVPKEGQTKEMRGDLQKAIDLYRQVGEKYPDSYVGQQSKQHAKELEAAGSKAVSFYSDMGNRPLGIKK